MANTLNLKITKYLRKLDPTIVGLKKIESIQPQKIGLGESNLNYLATINGKKFTIRINMDPKSPHKSEREFHALTIIESLGIAPKPFHYESSKQFLGETFLILEYLEGTSLDQYTELTETTISELGKLVAQLHITNIQKRENWREQYGSSKTDLLQEIKQRIEYITTKRRGYFQKNDPFEAVLNNTFQRLERTKIDWTPSYVLGHGDIAPQNVIFSEGTLKMIDWEDLGLIDPALEIAIVFDAFDFSEREQELFLNGYFEVREDASLKKKIPRFTRFQLFGVFCWAIMHIYEIGEGEMHEDFLKEQDLKEHIAYAEKMFHKCKKVGIISKNVHWNISEIVPETYLR